MITRKKYSLAIRITTGVLGLLGVGAIGFQAVLDGEIHADFLLFAKLFAGFIFFYVALFGTNPLDFLSQSDGDE